jgi:PAS domain S-box-containing protein
MLNGFALHEIICDPAGQPIDYRFLEVNPAFERLTGLQARDLIGRTVLEALPKTEPYWIERYGRVALTGQPLHFEDYAGELDTYYEVVAFSSQPGQFAVVISDVTARKQAEMELQRARDAAEAASRAKSDFLAHMSHELRTPLNAILGYTQVFKLDRTLTPKQQEGIDIIRYSGEHLLQMINDVLDVAKVEVGKLELYPAPVCLPHFLQALAEMIRVQAKQKGLAFTCQLDPVLPGGIYVDEKRLREVLLNLLSNAVKYTETGCVELSVAAVCPPGETEVKVRFQVIDTGIGIAPEALEEIFAPFYRMSGGSTNVEGTGLGLAISRHLVQLMGGEILVKSAPGQGSTFWFDLVLPIVAITEPTLRETNFLRPITGFKGRPVKVLIADDRPENRAMLREVLLPLGFTIIEAANGRETLEHALAELPDVILMDLVMPVMNGFETIRQIRQKVTSKYIVIIAISASIGGNISERCKKAGADDFLTKPIQLDDLFTCLETHLKLEWIYEPSLPEETQIPAGSITNAALPPLDDLVTLRNLAQAGLITRLEQLLTKICQADEAYQPFVEQMSRLADQFKFADIVALVDQYGGRRDH